MTARAMVGKVGAAGATTSDEVYWISLLLYGRRDREAAHGARQSRFRRVWLRKRAQIGRAHADAAAPTATTTSNASRTTTIVSHWTISCTGGRSVTKTPTPFPRRHSVAELPEPMPPRRLRQFRVSAHARARSTSNASLELGDGKDLPELMDMEVIGGLAVHFNAPEPCVPSRKADRGFREEPIVVLPSSRLAPHAGRRPEMTAPNGRWYG